MADPAEKHSGRGGGSDPADPASRLWQQWQQGKDPDARHFLRDAGPLTVGHIVAVLRVDQCQRWQRDKALLAEEYLRWYPQLTADPERALELIYGEYLLREELEQSPQPAEYIRRFPEFAVRLEQQLQLHRALEAVRATNSWAAPPSPAEPPEPSTINLPLPVVTGYEVQRELGRGGMGVVYVARNKLMDRLEALKVVNSERVGRAEAVERFLQEIRSAARLNHPNVATAYSAHQLGDLLVLAMEYVEGEDLTRVVRGRGPLPISNACFCVHQAALGLQRAHELGLVHRDIKPSNLLLGKQGKRRLLKIVDFGLAKARTEVPPEGGLTVSNQMLGTPGYTAPEQLRDAKSADIRADVYSLGCTLYYLLAGYSPFKGGSAYQVLYAQQTEKQKLLREVRSDAPQELADVVARMMAKDPSGRFQQPAEVAAALVPFIKQATKPPSSTGRAVTSTPLTAESDTLAPRDTSPGQSPPSRASGVEAGPSTSAATGDSGTGDTRSRTERTKTTPIPNSVAARKKTWIIALIVTVVLAGVLGLAAGVMTKLRATTGAAVATNVPADAETTVKSRGELVRPGAEPRPAVAAGATPTASVPKTPADGFVPLFNGTDLTGWKPHPIGKAEWSVEAGVLIGRGSSRNPGSGHLFYAGNVYENFQLRVEAMINHGGNSGLYFRAPFGPASQNGFPTGAYEAQINNTNSANNDVQHKTGSLSVNAKPVVNLPNSSFKDDEWFTMEVIADGPQIVVKVNGQVTANYVDAGPSSRFGQVALQVHDRDTVVRFREVVIKELPRGDRRLQWVHSKGDFEQLKGNVWFERSGDFRFLFREVERTADYVRLQRTEPWNHDLDVFVNLHRTKAEVTQGGSRKVTHTKVGSWKALNRPRPSEKSSTRHVGEWVRLLNGKDLAEWKAGGNDKVLWTLEGDALVARSPSKPDGVLATIRNDYDNFHLRMEMKGGEVAGSQVCLRCGPPGKGPGSCKGYSVKIGKRGDATEPVGAISIGASDTPGIDLAAPSVVPLQAGAWFRLEVIAQGNHFVVLVDGKTAVDYTDRNDTFGAGRIGLLCPGNGTVRVRKMEVKELPSADPGDHSGAK